MARICGLQGGTWQQGACAVEGILGTCVSERSTIRCLNQACATSYAERCTGTWTAAP